MCLIAVAHRASPQFPLVLAANRDEDYQRPTHDAHAWSDAPDVVGGIDALHGGSWLAVRRGGRFAAVTNLYGAQRRQRSRGALVRDFVTGERSPKAYAAQIAEVAGEFAGFHLLAGDAGGEVVYIAPEAQTPLADGVHAFSNAPFGEEWPKMRVAAAELQSALQISETEMLIEELLRFLATPRGTGSPQSEVFLSGDRYGTRSSTVIVVTATEILFAEQSFARGGVPQGERRLFCLVR
ncbi:MAG: NRDE family protein [Acidobacteriota bacterium]